MTNRLFKEKVFLFLIGFALASTMPLFMSQAPGMWVSWNNLIGLIFFTFASKVIVFSIVFTMRDIKVFTNQKWLTAFFGLAVYIACIFILFANAYLYNEKYTQYAFIMVFNLIMSWFSQDISNPNGSMFTSINKKLSDDHYALTQQDNIAAALLLLLSFFAFNGLVYIIMPIQINIGRGLCVAAGICGGLSSIFFIYFSEGNSIRFHPAIWGIAVMLAIFVNISLLPSIFSLFW